MKRCQGFRLAMTAVLLGSGLCKATNAIDPALQERIAPIGKVNVGATSQETTAAIVPAADPAAAGKTAYDSVCTACHSAGLAGAPKVGDKAAWSARIDQGIDVLYEHAIKGFQGKSGMLMPPKGGGELSDAEVKAAVDYMVGASK
jgi:cytochrome c5